MPPPFPWEAVMETGLGLLRLSPKVFWRLTPREFAAMAGLKRTTSAPLTRADLQALMARYPDERT
ncbi:rcc01693 family protein [Allorhizobium sonneratiae]|uniref:rcc01693 family protein n=1 Tax=Allorhizobium sonneratiae TaxID=2934936 RepID=UPI0030843842